MEARVQASVKAFLMLYSLILSASAAAVLSKGDFSYGDGMKRTNNDLSLKLSVRNITDCRYETVSGYPMPGRSVMGGIEYRF